MTCDDSTEQRRSDDEDVGSKVFIKFIGPREAGLTNVTQFEPFMLPTRRVALRASTAVMMRF